MTDYRLHQAADYAYYTIPELTALGLSHQFLLRPLNFRPDSLTSSVEQVYAHFLPDDYTLITGQQVHSDRVKPVDDVVLSPGQLHIIADIDGTMTARKDVALMSKYADCIPILLYDPVQQVQASIHSGWQGSLQQIGQKALTQLIQTYGSRVSDIRVACGPAIGFEDFEVTEEVYQQFWASTSDIPQAFKQKDASHWQINLKLINQVRFERLGILPEHYYDITVSTVTSSQCHSYRRDQANYGLMAVISYL